MKRVHRNDVRAGTVREPGAGEILRRTVVDTPDGADGSVHAVLVPQGTCPRRPEYTRAREGA
ncbi:hypothetical protein GCM10010145_16290 [Streptomyces ruber]|uniref:Uncharacterized protein n=2 Tax=Streptomyces TaxID=1883 RepID=A0A918B985_9ACTN|nr:hypothetical protein GCM10010145_16290 [Streptomyces ruber]